MLNPLDHRAQYKLKRITSLSKLSLGLSEPLAVLEDVARRANDLYRLAAQEEKADGTIRQTFDAYIELKDIQIKIKERFFQNVEYPIYLRGSLTGCSPRKNASVHAGSKIIFSEDIQNFFPSIKKEHVFEIWHGLFGFSKDVSALLTDLTTRDNSVPQGAVTSSFIANLVFWKYEPNLVQLFARKGFRYTRYVDDISVSSVKRLTKAEQSEIIRNIYGMLLHYSFRPKRSKHEILTSGMRMTTTKLVNNNRVALTSEQRRSTRSAVFEIEKKINDGMRGSDIEKQLTSVSSRVGRLGTLHPEEAGKLKVRLRKLRQLLASEVLPLSVSNILYIGPISDNPPWDL